ncbi:MAG: methyl-accepting chemotaxis protein, partial [Proteobacteria bacterium]|nr:methyl-accepting chemotaxis protein [Pseudomonadota bacterium]
MKTKLIGGFLIVAAIGAVIGIQGILKASEINDLATTMFKRDMVGMRHAAQANLHLIAVGRGVRSAVLTDSADDRNRQLQIVDEHLAAMHKELDASAQRFDTEQGRAMVAQARESALAYEAGIKGVIEALRNEPPGEARESVRRLFGKVRGLGDVADEQMTRMMDRKKSDADALNDRTDQIYAHINMLLIVLTCGGVLVGIAIGLLISRNLTRQLGGEPTDAVFIAQRIASGDLSVSVETRSNDRDSLMFAIRTMRDSLSRVVSQVRVGSDAVATATDQIASGNQDLS